VSVNIPAFSGIIRQKMRRIKMTADRNTRQGILPQLIDINYIIAQFECNVKNFNITFIFILNKIYNQFFV
jgi:hypothetical protein